MGRGPTAGGLLSPIYPVEPQDPGPGILDHGSRASYIGPLVLGA